MPRVVPSQVVKTIDRIFQHVRDGQTQATYTSAHASGLRGIIDLVKEIPQQLLIMHEDLYADMVLGLSAIEEQLELWRSWGSSDALPSMNRDDPVALIRRALTVCPDEYPPPSTTDLPFIPDNDLRESLRRDIGATNRAFQNDEWKAATVLAGAALEALLHWRLSQPPLTKADRKSAGSAAVSSKKLTKIPHANLDDWNLQELIEMAGQLKIIKPATVSAANLARNFCESNSSRSVCEALRSLRPRHRTLGACGTGARNP